MAKYKIGDKVNYLDVHKTVKSGTVEHIVQADIYKWNSENKNLYTITHCPYLRYEEEIIGLCEE